jgi:hypothetical protein
MQDLLIPYKQVMAFEPLIITVMIRNATRLCTIIEANYPVMVQIRIEFIKKYGRPMPGENVTLYFDRPPLTKKIEKFTITTQI